jgi:ferritin-like metal-binding protein YciE
MAKEKKLEDLFHDTLKDIYYAERKILKALPKMARAATSSDLKAAFEKHKEQTEGHVERLQQVFELMDKRPQGKTCGRSKASSPRARRSWRNSRACPHWTPA